MTPRPPRPLRSCHSVPATSARMVEKARGLPADLVFLDLEDSVAPGAKGAGPRGAVAAALRDGGFAAPAVGVRVNAADTPHCHRDIVAVMEAAGAAVDVVIVPKVESPDHVAFAALLLDALEDELGVPRGRVALHAQIETARGMADIARIAASAPARLEALVFGPGDYAASLGVPTTTVGLGAAGYPGDPWHHALSTILVAARANGLQAVDGPHAAVRDTEGLRASAARAAALGIDGKWSVHPDQIPVLNDVFGVTPEALARARDVLSAHAAAAAGGHGAAAAGGEMIDEATRKMAEGVVARAALTGQG